jgi:hypothetical protein
MSSEHVSNRGTGDADRPPDSAGPVMSVRSRRLAESVERARGSIVRARAKLDDVMADVRAVPDGLKTNVCHIIEHAFDELLAAERELSDAMRLFAAESSGGADQPPPR